MDSLANLLQHGTGNGWLLLPTAIMLGALHGLEPGHSKSMMAAFIVAIHGTVRQAVLLGIAATLSHTAIVWVVAIMGLYVGQSHTMETNEPYFQLASAILILLIGGWMLWRIYSAHHHSQEHEHGHHHSHDHEHHHGHGDAHALSHAEDIKQRFVQGKAVTDAQIILFGLTGGLIPCPAAITVLLLCLQLKHIGLGALLVFGFSVGLALTLVASGVIAALGLRSAVRRFHWIAPLMQKAPYLAGCITLAVGLYIGVQALLQMSA